MAGKQNHPHSRAERASEYLPLIQDLHRAGWSFSRIAEHLQAEGIPSPMRWRGKPARWHGNTVQRVLAQAQPGVDAENKPASTTPSVEPPEQQPYATVDVSGAVTITTSTGPITESGVRVTITPPPSHTPPPAPSQNSLIERVDTATLLALSWPAIDEYAAPLHPAAFLLRRRV